MFVLRNSKVKEYHFDTYQEAVDKMIAEFKEVTGDLISEQEIEYLQNPESGYDIMGDSDEITFSMAIGKTRLTEGNESGDLTGITYFNANDPLRNYVGWIVEMPNF